MSDVLQLKVRQFRGAADGPHLLVTGGVHGDEFEPVAAIARFAARIDPSHLHGRVTLVPVVNEDAFWRGARVAADGLDLARTCPGRPDGSITERTAHALSNLIRDADYYVDLHTGGVLYDCLPLAGYVLHSDRCVLAVQRRMARALDLPLLWGTSANLQGRSLSVARDANVPAIYAEHGGGGAMRQRGIEDYVDGLLNLLAELDMVGGDTPARPSRVTHVVEDERDRSGHLQVQHPSPADGLFEPAVELGASVRAGDPIGTVSDVFGERVDTVRARETGVVLMLRAFNRVREGDALAAVAPADRTVEGWRNWR
jgi:predicted deacylase